jgi:hypothetical protein
VEERHLRAVAEDLGDERGRAFEDELTDGSVAGAEEVDAQVAQPLLDTLRIKFGRIDSSEAPNTANDRADQLALSAGMRGRVVLAKTIGARLAPLMD